MNLVTAVIVIERHVVILFSGKVDQCTHVVTAACTACNLLRTRRAYHEAAAAVQGYDLGMPPVDSEVVK
jgi:hypothetical protein